MWAGRTNSHDFTLQLTVALRQRVSGPMTRKLKRIAPLQLGIVAGVFYALFSLILVPIFLLMAIASALAPHTEGSTATQSGIGVGLGLVFAVLAPILYGVMGFIFGALAGLVYNLVAKWTGGIEFEVE